MEGTCLLLFNFYCNYRFGILACKMKAAWKQIKNTLGGIAVLCSQ